MPLTELNVNVLCGVDKTDSAKPNDKKNISDSNILTEIEEEPGALTSTNHDFVELHDGCWICHLCGTQSNDKTSHEFSPLHLRRTQTVEQISTPAHGLTTFVVPKFSSTSMMHVIPYAWTCRMEVSSPLTLHNSKGFFKNIDGVSKCEQSSVTEMDASGAVDEAVMSDVVFTKLSPGDVNSKWSCNLCKVSGLRAKDFWHHCLGDQHMTANQNATEKQLLETFGSCVNQGVPHIRKRDEGDLLKRATIDPLNVLKQNSSRSLRSIENFELSPHEPFGLSFLDGNEAGSPEARELISDVKKVVQAAQLALTRDNLLNSQNIENEVDIDARLNVDTDSLYMSESEEESDNESTYGDENLDVNGFLVDSSADHVGKKISLSSTPKSVSKQEVTADLLLQTPSFQKCEQASFPVGKKEITAAIKLDERLLHVFPNEKNNLWSCNLCWIQDLQGHSIESHCLGKFHTAAVAVSKIGFRSPEQVSRREEITKHQERLAFDNEIQEESQSDERFQHLHLIRTAWSCSLCNKNELQLKDVKPHCLGKVHAKNLVKAKTHLKETEFSGAKESPDQPALQRRLSAEMAKNFLEKTEHEAAMLASATSESLADEADNMLCLELGEDIAFLEMEIESPQKLNVPVADLNLSDKDGKIQKSAVCRMTDSKTDAHNHGAKVPPTSDIDSVTPRTRARLCVSELAFLGF